MPEEAKDTPRRPPVKAPPIPLLLSPSPMASPPGESGKLENSAATQAALELFSYGGVQAKAFTFDEGELRPPKLYRALNHVQLGSRRLLPQTGIQAIASFILDRARAGAIVRDAFGEDDDYACFADEGGVVPPHEIWARAAVEHLTGIPLLDPCRLYAEGQPAIARMLFLEGRYPLAGQVQDAVTAALCIGGWDGAGRFDVGTGKEGLTRCDEVLPASELRCNLTAWSDDLWAKLQTGVCFFWDDPESRRGHVAMLLRKHPPHAGTKEERVIQLWGAPLAPDGTDQKPPRVFAEPDLQQEIPPEVLIAGSTLRFCGIGMLRGLGSARTDMRPRGRCRLLLRQRLGERKLLYCSAWLSMAAEGLSIARLLGSIRSIPRHDEIEATWCVNSMCLTPTQEVEDNRPLLDCTTTPKGRVRIRCDMDQGFHRRPDEDAEACGREAPYIDADGEGAEF